MKHGVSSIYKKPKLLIGFLIVMVILISKTNSYEDMFTEQTTLLGFLKVANGVVSVFQNSTVSASAMGLSGELAIGEILDPLNDLIEKASDVVFFGMVFYAFVGMVLGTFQLLWTKIAIGLIFCVWAYFQYKDKASPLISKIFNVLIVSGLLCTMMGYSQSFFKNRILMESQTAFMDEHKKAFSDLDKFVYANIVGKTNKNAEAKEDPSFFEFVSSLPSKLQTASNKVAKSTESFIAAMKKFESEKYFTELRQFLVDYLKYLLVQIVIIPLVVFVIGKKFLFE